MTFFQYIKIVFLLGFLLATYTVFIERYIVRFPKYELSLEGLPKEFDHFTILVISDLHYGALMPGFWVEYLIEKANRQNADMIVGVGDYVHAANTDVELRTVWPILNKLRAKHGVYFVNGNHDHWANHFESLKYLEESGFSVRHENRKITIGTESIIIAGTGDFTEDEVGIDKALAGAGASDFKIVLTHNPDAIDTPHKSRVDLFIAGHTHGGQVRIPFLEYSPILPVKNKSYDLGLKFSDKGEPVFISKGIGWAILPVRFYAMPEIPVLVLKSNQSGS